MFYSLDFVFVDIMVQDSRVKCKHVILRAVIIEACSGIEGGDNNTEIM